MLDLSNMIMSDKGTKKEYDLLDPKYKLIKALIDYRIKNGLSRKDIAARMNVKERVIENFEYGNSDPKMDFIAKLLYCIDMEIIVTAK